MYRDAIVEELWAVKDRLAKESDYDVRAIVKDAQKRQRESGRKAVTLPPKRRVSSK